MLSKIMRRSNGLINNNFRMIASKAQLQKSTDAVELRGTFLKGKRSDLPTMIWFSDLVEPVENHKAFFE